MNRLATLFRQKQAGILSVYFCAGHPHSDSTLPVLRALQQGGADLVEVGIPLQRPAGRWPYDTGCFIGCAQAGHEPSLACGLLPRSAVRESSGFFS